MQQIDHWTGRNGSREGASGPLPQFDLWSSDAVDADRTLERLPRITTELVAAVPDVPVRRARTALRGSDDDMAATVEIVPEVALGDILEEVETALPEPSPVTLPPPVPAPLDLDRLLALARAETGRSSEYFRAPNPEGSSVSHSPGTVVATTSRLDPTMVLPVALERTQRRVWLVGTALSVAAITLGIVIGQAQGSSVRSPQSLRVSRPAAALESVAGVVAPMQSAQPAAPTIPAMSVQSLPVAAVGTISLAAVAASHRLFVDGKVAQGGTAVVSCGKHVVQVGSHGLRRSVEVACGQEVVLAK